MDSGENRSVKIILASASPRRRELLEQVGLHPVIIPSRADEKTEDLPPEKLVRQLSARKAGEVLQRLSEDNGKAGEARRRLPPDSSKAGEIVRADKGRAGEMVRADSGEAGEEDAVIIGADTVVSVDGRILGKPGSEEEAAQMLSMIQGRTHEVYTGVTMIFVTSGETITFSERTEVEVYPMNDREIRRYIATGEPADKAGAYGIQGCFAAFIKGIRGDYNNVVGLPSGRVCQELRDRKYGC